MSPERIPCLSFSHFTGQISTLSILYAISVLRVSQQEVELSTQPSYLVLACLEPESGLGLCQIACGLQPVDVEEGIQIRPYDPGNHKAKVPYPPK